jgi:hypothetical protein
MSGMKESRRTALNNGQDKKVCEEKLTLGNMMRSAD